jgi:tetratricopeptide (TPR) repeat protein
MRTISTMPSPEHLNLDSIPNSDLIHLEEHKDLVLEEAEINDIFIEALNAHLSGNLKKAYELYTHLLHISPNHYLYNHRGLVNLSLCKYDEALQDFSTAIGLNQQDIRVYTNRGLTYRMLKNYDLALADFDESLKKNPIWTDAFYGRALTHYDMGNISLAIEDCDSAIAINEGFIQAMKFKQFLLNNDI